MAYKQPTSKLGTPQYTQQLFSQAAALGLKAPSSALAPAPVSSGSSVAKPGALAMLSNTPAFVAPTSAPGIVPQVYSGSTGSGSNQNVSTNSYGGFTSPPPASPVRSSSGGGTPAPVSSGNPISNAFSGAYNALVKAGNWLTSPNSTSSTGNQSATALQAFQNAIQPNQTLLPNQTMAPPPTDATTVAGGVQTTATTVPPQVGTGDIKTQYQTITQDKTSYSKTLQNQLSQTKALEDSQRQSQAETIKAKIAELTAQRDAMIAAEQVPPVPPLDQPLDQPYAPQNQPNIAALDAQIKAFQDELAQAMGDSPEYTAATEALNAKMAEEAQIKSRLQEGQTNIAEQPIAYSFIGGQQAALERRAQADLGNVYAAQIPLTQRLATEQAKKQSAIDVVKAKYGFAGDERKYATDIYNQNYERQNQLTDKATTRSQQLADQATEQANKLALEAAKSKTTSSNTSSANITSLRNALNNSKFQGAEADGKYADPNLYLQNYNSYPDKAEFLRLFPPATYINPANTFLPQEIMQFVKQSEARSI